MSCFRTRVLKFKMCEKRNKRSGHVQKAKINICKPHDIQRSKTYERSHEFNRIRNFSFFNKIGPKQIESLKTFIPSMICYTIATGLCTAYLCEWKDVLQYLPYYRGKYKEPQQ